MINSQQLIAQIESLAVDSVRDLRIGLSPSNAKYIKNADFTVVRRWRLREDGSNSLAVAWMPAFVPPLACIGAGGDVESAIPFESPSNTMVCGFNGSLESLDAIVSPSP
jgi:hypothetical protein